MIMKKIAFFYLLIILITFAGHFTRVYAATLYGSCSLAFGGFGGSLFDPNSCVPDDELNNMIGSNIFTRIDFLKTGPNTKTNSENTVVSSGGRVAGASIAKVAGISTGTAGSLALSAALSLLITLSYLVYARTGLFKKREALSIIQKHRSDKNRFNFASQNR